MYTIGFSGKMGSGKDYTAELVIDEIMKSHPSAKIKTLTYAAALRNELDYIAKRIKESYKKDELSHELNVTEEELSNLYNLFLLDSDFWSPEYSTFNRTPKAREILQYWGTDVRRNQNNNYWVEKTIESAKKFNIDYLFITDIRFPNEAEGVKKLNGYVIECIVDDIERLSRLKARGVNMTNETLTHPSEIAMDNYNSFDLQVDTGKSDSLSNIISFLKSHRCL